VNIRRERAARYNRRDVPLRGFSNLQSPNDSDGSLKSGWSCLYEVNRIIEIYPGQQWAQAGIQKFDERNEVPTRAGTTETSVGRMSEV
jgi:hypothetical protein